MILVQNLLQRLSGSKIIFGVLFVFVTSGCFTTKKVVKKPIEMRKETVVVKKEEPIEVIDSSDIVEENVLQNSQNEKVDSFSKYNNVDIYNVSLLLPFMGNLSVNALHPKSDFSLQYYAGIQLAVEEMEKQGLRIHLDVFDTQANISKIAALLENPILEQSHLIFGPANKNNVQIVSEFSQKNQILMVSPISASPLQSKNELFIHLKPTFEAHAKAIVNHVLKKVPAENVVLVARENNREQNRFGVFDNAYREILGIDTLEGFKKMLIPNTPSEWTQEFVDFEGFVDSLGTSVFVIPSWSSERFVNSFLRLLRIADKGRNQVVVYGMPQWRKFKKLNFGNLEALNVHLSTNSVINRENFVVNNFYNKFLEKFGVPPDKNAYDGHDGLLYSIELMRKFGNNLSQIDSFQKKYLASTFELQPVINEQSIQEENYKADYYENTNVRIIRFKNFVFEEAK